MTRLLTISHLRTQSNKIYIHAHGIRPSKHLAVGHIRIALANCNINSQSEMQLSKPTLAFWSQIYNIWIRDRVSRNNTCKEIPNTSSWYFSFIWKLAINTHEANWCLKKNWNNYIKPCFSSSKPKSQSVFASIQNVLWHICTVFVTAIWKKITRCSLTYV